MLLAKKELTPDQRFARERLLSRGYFVAHAASTIRALSYRQEPGGILEGE
jgi:hypothetical protein